MARRSFACLLALVPAIAMASVAQAKFQTPVVISDTNTGQQQVAMNAGGTAIVVWQHYNTDLGNYEIQGLIRGADGTYGTVETLSIAAGDTSSPRAPIDKAGKRVRSVVRNRRKP